MRASIIIATHQEGDRLRRTIESCVETTTALDRELIVADDASTDDSVDEATRHFPHVRVFRHEKRRGASPTKALGAENARGDVFVFLDGHTKPEYGAITRLVEDVEQLDGQAVVTPKVVALDCGCWMNDKGQAGHGYYLNLDDFSCGWLSLSELRIANEGRRTFFESPALIGCALAVSRRLYEKLWGFDSRMRFWGVEDLDFGLKCCLLGHRILHDPEAVVGHRFRNSFDNFLVPAEHVIVNQLRMARKSFTLATWSDWVDRCRGRHPGRPADHPEGLWALAWQIFEAERASVEQERSYLLGHRIHDEFWYAERFSLQWPRFGAEAINTPRAALLQPSPSPSPAPCSVEKINGPTAVCAGSKVTFRAVGKSLSKVKWTGGGNPATGTGSSFSTTFATAGTYTVTASCNNTSASLTVTVVSITISPSPIRTGFIGPSEPNPLPCNLTPLTIETDVTATVVPASYAPNVTLKIAKNPRAIIKPGSIKVDPIAGTITCKIIGRSMTPTTAPKGDTELRAIIGGGKVFCAKVPVIVIVPFSLKPVSAGPTHVTGVNQAASLCTSPTFFNRRANVDFVILWTYWVIDLDVPVLDQFGMPLDPMYDGAQVFEQGNDGVWRTIIQQVNGGSYTDPVGSLTVRPPPPQNSPNFRPNDMIAVDWPTAPLGAMPARVDVQNIGVRVAGFTMNPGVVGRTVTSVPDAPGATAGTIEIDWQ